MNRLELGPCNNPLGGCDTVDVFEHYHPTYCFDMIKTQIWPISDNSYNEVYAIHVLEHFNLNSMKIVFTNVYRILQSKGKFIIHVPNGPIIAKAYANKPEVRLELQPCFFGSESESEPTFAYAHKTLFDTNILGNLYLEFGFKNLKEYTDNLIDRHDTYWFPIVEGKFSLKTVGEKP